MSLDIRNADDIQVFVLSLLKDDHGITAGAYANLLDLFHEVPNLVWIWENVEAIDGRFYLPEEN